MTRATLSVANRDASSAQAVSVTTLVSVFFPSGAMHLTTADRDITALGLTFLSNGVLLSAGAAEEAGDLKPRTVTISLAGAAPGLISTIRAGGWQFAQVDIYLAFFNSAGALVGDPYLAAARMLASAATISLGEDSSEITLEVETRDVLLQRNSAVLATDGAQRARSPGDTGLRTVVDIADKVIEWGGKTQSVGTTVPGRSGRTLYG